MRMPRDKAIKWAAASANAFKKTCRGLATESSAEEINATGLPLAQRCKVCQKNSKCMHCSLFCHISSYPFLWVSRASLMLQYRFLFKYMST